MVTSHGEHFTSLLANLIGTLYYVTVAALVIPFRDELDVSIAGFMLVNACFASLGTTYVTLTPPRHPAVYRCPSIRACRLILENTLGMFHIAHTRDKLRHYAFGLPVEAADIVPDHRPPAGWPSTGRITVKGLRVRYSPELPDVIKGVEFVCEPGMCAWQRAQG